MFLMSLTVGYWLEQLIPPPRDILINFCFANFIFSRLAVKSQVKNWIYYTDLRQVLLKTWKIFP